MSEFISFGCPEKSMVNQDDSLRCRGHAGFRVVKDVDGHSDSESYGSPGINGPITCIG